MNRKLGMVSALINVIAVSGFAISMLCLFNFGSYLFSVFIALAYVPVACCFAIYAEKDRRAAGIISVCFAAVYATIVLLVYFAQLTTVNLQNLTPQASELLDFRKFGLMFNYDLLGYAAMSLSTFFAGLTVKARTKADGALKILLLVHGIFFISCLIMPMLGIFKAGGSVWTGVAVLEFWCAYFLPVGILSFNYFNKSGNVKSK